MASFEYGDYKIQTYGSEARIYGVVDRTKTAYSEIPAQVVYDGTTYTVTELSEAFRNCPNLITPPAIPNTVVSMYRTFMTCRSMTSAPIIPSSVRRMEETFAYCSSLVTPPTIQSGVTNMYMAFSNCTSLETAPVIPSSVTDLSCTFEVCTSLTTAPTIPSSVTDINSCFSGCTSLTTAPAIPSSVTTMRYCFKDCTSLTTAPVIQNGVVQMDYCFSGCTNLITAPTIPNGVKYMTSCFFRCTSLTTAPTIPSSVTNMLSCFRGCISLTTAPDMSNATAVTTMYYCFYGCTSLTTAPTIPSSVTNMTNCFRDCSSLTTAPAIPSSVTDMGHCFDSCSSLTTAPAIPSSVTNMLSCFRGCIMLEGNIIVSNNPTTSTNVFANTNNDIYIIPNNLTSGATTGWKSIASTYQNVHYYLDDTSLTLRSFVGKRTDYESTTESDDGVYAYLQAVYSLSGYVPLGISLSISKTLKQNGTVTSVTWTESTTDDTTTITTWTPQSTRTTATWELTVSVEDKISALSVVLPGVFIAVDFYHDSTSNDYGIAFGKPATNTGFECIIPTLFEDDLVAQDMTAQEVDDFVDSIGGGGSVPSEYKKLLWTNTNPTANFTTTTLLNGTDLTVYSDYVIEQGTSGIWTYRKWNSGIAECWGRTSISGLTTNIRLPFTFADDSYETQVTLINNSNTATNVTAIISFTNSVSIGVNVVPSGGARLFIIGTWK